MIKFKKISKKSDFILLHLYNCSDSDNNILININDISRVYVDYKDKKSFTLVILKNRTNNHTVSYKVIETWDYLKDILNY